MNLDRVEAVLQLLARSRVAEVSLEGEGWSIAVRRGALPAPPHAAPAAAAARAEEPAEPQPALVTAPMVGIFRAAKTPLQPGDTVTEGQTVGIIESMRIPNPVVSEYAGIVAELFVEDGDPVDYGHEILSLRPEPAA